MADLSGTAFAPFSVTTRIVLSVGPLSIFAVVVTVVGIIMGGAAAGFLAGAALSTFVGGGKLVILVGAVASAPLGVAPLAALVIYSDFATTLFLLANMQSFYRLPWLGVRLAAAREAGWRVLQQHPWMRRFTWLGLAVFIAVPFQGTGALLGVIIGRLLGLSRLEIFTAITCGSTVGSLVVAVTGSVLDERITALASEPLLGIMTIAILLLGAYLLGRWLVGHAEPR